MTGTGDIKGVPPELVQKQIDHVSSSGDYGDIDREIERFKAMEAAGLTDLALRVFDDPWVSLETIKTRVMPHFDTI